MESSAHLQLKRAALAHLRRLGCCALAMEVRCPISRYRVDVAGYFDRDPFSPTSRSASSRTIMIECKQSREDFLRHVDALQPLLDLRQYLHAIRASIEEHRIKRQEPELRISGSALFTQFEQWDFASSRLKSYRNVLRKLRIVDQRLHGHTKFFMIARYGLADMLYIAAPHGMVGTSELPRGWGLLECSIHKDAELDVSLKAPLHQTKPQHRHRLLRNIAAAASFAAYRDLAQVIPPTSNLPEAATDHQHSQAHRR